MFDQAPSNLPMEPLNGPAPQPPIDLNATARPASAVPKPAPAAAPASAPVAASGSEPEDIFGNMERANNVRPNNAPMMDLPDATPPSLDRMRTALFVVGGIAAVIVLGLGGYFVYARFIAPPPVTPTPIVEDEPMAPEDEPIVEDDFPVEDPNASAVVDEAPPAVEPTPTPENIPPPTPVGQQSVDTDGDGLTDTEEASAGTEVLIADTDGDGLLDGEERTYVTDPRRSDTDGDGLTDGDEVRLWRTMPANPDTDGDTYSDGEEVRNGFNPNGPGKLSAN